jgi:hypothetical protein
MSIAGMNSHKRAPLGAACHRTQSREAAMPLLPELVNNPSAPCGYKHAAPGGADSAALW